MCVLHARPHAKQKVLLKKREEGMEETDNLGRVGLKEIQ